MKRFLIPALAVAALFTVAVQPAHAVRQRADGTCTATGVFVPGQAGYVAGKWCLMHNAEYVNVKGTGYVQVRWEFEYWFHHGSTAMPTVTRSGNCVFVGNGGGHYMSDKRTYSGHETNETWLGKPSVGFSTTPRVVWQNEFYWLGGGTSNLYILNRESSGDASYNLGIGPVTYSTVNADINHAATGSEPWLRKGVSHDN